MISNLLEKFGLKHEELNVAERETLDNWLKVLSEKQLTVEGVKEYIRKMIDGVEMELVGSDIPKTKDLFLKARLRNYLLLAAFLESPDKAKKALENQLKNIKPK